MVPIDAPKCRVSEYMNEQMDSFFVGVGYHVACGVLVPQPGIEPGPPTVEVPSPNHWTPREFLHLGYLYPLFEHCIGQTEMKLHHKTQHIFVHLPAIVDTIFGT